MTKRLRRPPRSKRAVGMSTLAAQLATERDQLKEQLDGKQQSNAASLEHLSADLARVRHARAAHSLMPETDGQKKVVEQAQALEALIQQKFRDIRVAARFTALALDGSERALKQLKDDQSELEAFVVGSRGTARGQSLFRIGACTAFMLATVVPLSLIRRRRRRERVDQSRKCPRCLNKDTLDFVAASSDHEFDEGQTMFRLKVCNACDYEIRENYVHENRLCFPTVGIPSSGKTHWLLMLYDQIKNSNIPVASTIRKIPSREDQRASMSWCNDCSTLAAGSIPRSTASRTRSRSTSMTQTGTARTSRW